MADNGATVCAEKDITISGLTPVRLDTSPLAARRFVRVINLSQTVRVFIGHTQATTTTLAETSGKISGVWEDFISSGIQVWAVTENGSSVTVRLKEYT
jgi:hypothetical protein